LPAWKVAVRNSMKGREAVKLSSLSKRESL
jgi:hypothetical protein